MATPLLWPAPARAPRATAAWRPLAIALLGVGCARPSCSSTGCVPAIDVAIDSPLVAAGVYHLTLHADGNTVECHTRLPEPSPQSGCNAALATLIYAPVAAGWALGGVSLRTASVSQLTVVVRRDRTQLASQHFSPDYEAWYPNGPVCDDAPCRYAALTMSMEPSTVARNRQ